MEDPEYGVKPIQQQSQQKQKPTVRHIQAANANNTIPADILQNEALNKAIATLPGNYSFEIHKTLWRMRKCNATRVALQFPEGLLMYSCIITDILEKFGNVEVIIMGDVTYGACCIDDLSAIQLGCDFMVHYGHSCLVPIDLCQIPTLYVFVDITFNHDHLIMMLLKQLDPQNTHLILAGTIQFSSTIQSVGKIIKNSFLSVTIPQAKPLSQGEVLGCTSPRLIVQQNAKNSKTTTTNGTINTTNTIKIHINNVDDDIDDSLTFGHGAAPDGFVVESNVDSEPQEQESEQTCCNTTNTSCCNTNASSSTTTCCSTTTINPDDKAQEAIDAMQLPEVDTQPENIVCVFLADGRFHLESLMIQNPHIPRYLRYDPYNRMMTEESYDFKTMHERRYKAIQIAKTAQKWGVILGTLGRQGSTHILQRIEQALQRGGKEYVPILLSEVFPTKLSLLSSQCDAWVQIACPRLSVDWASGFEQPLLSPYEFFVCMSELEKEKTTTTTTKQEEQQEKSATTNLTPETTATEWLPGGVYPMDYYSSHGGEWTNYFHKHEEKRQELLNPNKDGKKMSGKEALAMLRARRTAAKETKVTDEVKADAGIVDAAKNEVGAQQKDADGMD